MEINVLLPDIQKAKQNENSVLLSDIQKAKRSQNENGVLLPDIQKAKKKNRCASYLRLKRRKIGVHLLPE